jgi:hypothetical protein
MKTAEFRSTVDSSSEALQSRIRRCLGMRHCMSLGELRLRLGESEDIVRAELESMMLRGDVERIRPADYVRSDRDMYAVPKPEGHAWEN